ncbi:MAG: NAD(P)H-hydrate dehydratase [Candidatus Heimdallarchaeota archaeon]|nr:NAD(P)H-hydrate dehydratase [Candidatus Heimdallarchaeota archaeon]
MKIPDLTNLIISDVVNISREESVAIELNEFENGNSAINLMKNAGKQIANELLKSNYASYLFLIGGGNNGGDGIVAAGIISENSLVNVFVLKEIKASAAETVFKELETSELSILLEAEITSKNLKEACETADVIVDAIFGVGLKSKIRDPISSYLQILADYNQKIVSIDLPSGFDCNTGEWYGPKIIPSSVITMHATKMGFSKLDPNTEVIVVDIGIAKESSYFVGPGHIKSFWKKRHNDSHKGNNGRIMIVGGSDGFTGAPVLSGMACLRAGVDTLRIAVPSVIRDIVASYAEDFIILKVDGDKITSKGFKRYRDLAIKRHDVMAIGMGISNHPEVTKFVREIIPIVKDRLTVLLDADAIRAFHNNLEILQGSDVIITPHRAELRTMLDEAIPDEFDELVGFLEVKAAQMQITILLKGPIDIITNGHRTLLNKTGHPGMTVGGTGDVLAGLVAAVNCFVDDKLFATAIAAYVMGKAGELAAKKYGNGLLASDVVKEIPKVLLEFDL